MQQKKKQNRRALIIVNAYIVWPAIQSFCSRISEELNHLGITTGIVDNGTIQTWVDAKGNVKNNVPECDFVLYLDKDPYIASMLEKARYRLFNSAEAIALCDDKMETYLHLSGHGIAMPKTISAPLCYYPKGTSSFLNHLEKELPYPFVAKENFGSQGKGVYLIENREDLENIQSSLLTKPHLYQEFIAPSKGKDYRLIVVGGRYLIGYQRESSTDFRSNIAQGGHGNAVIIDEAKIALAEKAAKLLNLDYCGVDILDSGDPQRPILCEVNSNAFFEEAERVTGINVAKAYAEHIVRQVYEN